MSRAAFSRRPTSTTRWARRWKRSSSCGFRRPGSGCLAACLCLGFFGYWQPHFAPYGTLRIQINPDVALTVSKTDRVLEARGLNEDGEALLDDLDLEGKDSDDAVEDLVEKAIERGYLTRGGTVAITASSEDDDWVIREEAALEAQLWKEYGDHITVLLGSAPPPAQPEQTAPAASESAPAPSAPAASESAPAASTPAVPPASSQPAAPVQGDRKDDWDPTGSDYPHDSDDWDDDDDDDDDDHDDDDDDWD